MKHRPHTHPRATALPLKTALLTLICTLPLGAPHSRAATLYWDANGTDTGAGASPSGTWGLDSFWNTDATGGDAGAFQAATTSADNLFIVAGPGTGSGDGDFTIALNGSTQSANKITFQGKGNLTLGDDTKTINLSGGLAVVNDSAYANLVVSVDANIALQGNQSFNITRGSVSFNGVISGTGNLTVNGNSATKFFNAANTYVGTTTISNAALTLGGTSGSVGTGDVIFSAEHFGSLVFNHSADFIFSNNITGTGNTGAVTKLGSNTLTLTGNNTYSGITLIRSGAVRVDSINQRLGTSGIRLGTSTDTGTLIYTGSGETVTRTMTLQGTTGGGVIQSDGTGALVFSGDFAAGTNGAKTLTLQGSNTDNNEIQGVISQQTAKTSVTKSGAGKWILSGVNTYTGATTVSKGTLLVNGSLAAGGTVAVQNGGTLGGFGTIGGDTTADGGSFLSPGDNGAAGTLAFSGTLDLSALAAGPAGGLLFDLGATASSDKITAGTLDIGSGSLNFASFSFTALDGFGAGTYTLFSATSVVGSFDSTAGSLEGAVGGFSGLLSLSGNDLLLTVTPVPEPSACAALLGGIVVVFAALRRRRARECV